MTSSITTVYKVIRHFLNFYDNIMTVIETWKYNTKQTWINLTTNQQELQRASAVEGTEEIGTFESEFCARALCKIYVKKRDKTSKTLKDEYIGTGVIIRGDAEEPDFYILTAYHNTESRIRVLKIANDFSKAGSINFEVNLPPAEEYEVMPSKEFPHIMSKKLDFCLLKVTDYSITCLFENHSVGLNISPNLRYYSEREHITVMYYSYSKAPTIEKKITSSNAFGGRYLIQDNNLFIKYETTTYPGTSGAPVFNNSYQLMGVHIKGDNHFYGKTAISLASIINFLMNKANFCPFHMKKFNEHDECDYSNNAKLKQKFSIEMFDKIYLVHFNWWHFMKNSFIIIYCCYWIFKKITLIKKRL